MRVLILLFPPKHVALFIPPVISETQIVFPLLMFVYVNRIVWSRVRPDHSPLRFEHNPDASKGCFLFKACG